jgi:heme oxygenase (biliverdin-IX-beta and delta-forming)
MHAALETLFTSVLDPGGEGYGEFLARSARALFALEPVAVAAGARRLLPDWAQRSRLVALQLDLCDLGVGSENHSPLLGPQLANDAPTFGALYVLEGSRLGAKSILRHIGHTLQGQAAGGARFLCDGRGLSLWGTLLSLGTSEAVAQRPSDAIHGAKIAFAGFAEAAVALGTSELPSANG